jgi:hypothetical protein
MELMASEERKVNSKSEIKQELSMFIFATVDDCN